MTPVARSLGKLREMGYTADVVERWIQWAKVRKDLFGFGDILAFSPPSRGQSTIAILQVTTVSNMSARRKKILSLPVAANWLRAGGEIWIWGWRKGKSKRWECKATEVTLGEFGEG